MHCALNTRAIGSSFTSSRQTNCRQDPNQHARPTSAHSGYTHYAHCTSDPGARTKPSTPASLKRLLQTGQSVLTSLRAGRPKRFFSVVLCGQSTVFAASLLTAVLAAPNLLLHVVRCARNEQLHAAKAAVVLTAKEELPNTDMDPSADQLLPDSASIQHLKYLI